jgi:chromate transporter
VLYGIKPAVTAIVIFAAYRIGSRTIRSVPLIALAIGAFVATVLFAIPFPMIVAAAALIGFAGGRLAPRLFRGAGGSHAGSATAAGRGLCYGRRRPRCDRRRHADTCARALQGPHDDFVFRDRLGALGAAAGRADGVLRF